MATIRATFDGKVFVPDELVSPLTCDHFEQAGFEALLRRDP